MPLKQRALLRSHRQVWYGLHMRFLYRLSILCAIALCTACRAELSDTARIDLSPTALADAQIVIDSAKNDLQLLVQRPDFQARFRQEYE